ncbi:MAG: hypothetical protein J6N44_03570 [Acidaminococcaceae bacterium]|nr:hypothetical protein [Acidaminococcaceae bacterium]
MLDPYERLANAVIIQAVKDYRRETGTFESNPEKAKIIEWIMSRNFSAITDLDPVALVEALKKEDERK